MLTSFFRKSSPVNYLILSVFVSIVAIATLFFEDSFDFSWPKIATNILAILGCVFSILLLDFIIRKNQLTLGNTYAIFLFSCFFTALPIVFLQPKLLLANILCLLAIRRVFSLSSEKNRSKKILDASLYISFASLFYFPSIGFLIFLFVAIIKHVGPQFKTLLIPVIGALSIFILTTTYHLLVSNSTLWIYEWFQPISFDFTNYNKLHLLIPITIFISIGIWSGGHLLYKLPSFAKKERPKALLILVLMVVSVVVTLASNSKSGAEILYMLPALSILAANYISFKKLEATASDVKAAFLFKELLLWCALLLPILNYVFL